MLIRSEKIAGASEQVCSVKNQNKFQNWNLHTIRFWQIWSDFNSVLCGYFTKQVRPYQAKKYLRTCAKSTDSDHPAHARSISRAFAFHSYIVYSVSISGLRRSWSDVFAWLSPVKGWYLGYFWYIAGAVPVVVREGWVSRTCLAKVSFHLKFWMINLEYSIYQE